jgi:uncharacterized Zn-finger protein
LEKECLYCGKVIKVKPSHYKRKKYCSRDCKTKYQREHPPDYWKKLIKKEEVVCSYCGKRFLRKPSAIQSNNFCNWNCRKLYLKEYGAQINQHLKKQVTVCCKVCNRKFQVIKSRERTAKYCSKKCLGKANGIRSSVQYKKRKVVYCNNCKSEIEKKPSEINKLNFCSVDCMGIYYEQSKMFAGENSGTWAGGDIDYYGPNWRSQRRKARERDNFTCQDCGISEKEFGQELSVHHIIPFRRFNGDWEKANQLSNLVTLCEYPCHRNRHSKMKT